MVSVMASPGGEHWTDSCPTCKTKLKQRCACAQGQPNPSDHTGALPLVLRRLAHSFYREQGQTSKHVGALSRTSAEYQACVAMMAFEQCCDAYSFSFSSVSLLPPTFLVSQRTYRASLPDSALWAGTDLADFCFLFLRDAF